MGMEYSLSISPEILNDLPCSYCGDSVSDGVSDSRCASFFCCDCDLPDNVLFKRMDRYKSYWNIMGDGLYELPNPFSGR